MTNARELVTRRLARRARQFPDLELSPLDTESLEPRDAGLASAIDHAVARRWLTLRAVLEPHLRRPWPDVEGKLQAVLLVGAAQLLLLERVPEHAAINEAVEVAKRFVRPGAGGLVNAVLRRISGLRREIVDGHDPDRRDELPLDDGRAWRLDGEVFAADPLSRLAAQTSHPVALLEHWARARGHDTAARLAAHGLVHAPIILAGVPEGTGDVEPHQTPGFGVFTGTQDALRTLLAAHSAARVQDPGSAAPVEATRGLEPELIIDACAGKGTKTRQLLAVHPRARIVATDVDLSRLATLRTVFAGVERVEVVEPDGLGPWRGRADLLLLDVPCSNTGVLARRVEAKYRFSPQSLGRLVDLQRQIVADTILLVRDGGHLLYATCSLEPAENEEMAEWISRWHPMQRKEEASRIPAGGPGDPPATYSDGGYFALLRRQAG